MDTGVQETTGHWLLLEMGCGKRDAYIQKMTMSFTTGDVSDISMHALANMREAGLIEDLTNYSPWILSDI
jgi:hypothetical protein